jgi:hypothetical protein
MQYAISQNGNTIVNINAESAAHIIKDLAENHGYDWELAANTLADLLSGYPTDINDMDYTNTDLQAMTTTTINSGHIDIEPID